MTRPPRSDFFLALLLCLTACGRTRPAAGHGPVRALPADAPDSTNQSLRWFALDAHRNQVLDALLEHPSWSEDRGAAQRLLRTLAALDAKWAFPAVRQAMIELQHSTERGLQKVFALGARLKKESPDDPDRLFLEGYLRWLVARSPAGAKAAQAVDLQPYWGRLVKEHPSYRGPGGVTAAWIETRLRELARSPQ